ncbi:RHS repeat-associated core domain-containing protein [Amycolatopsis sp. MtRt-6]|uniref:RHS repeat-associated core domain-containing protein n=1 Tax=Amycolatopsis sp. MtRt-6 TaxID=2792782 RepID=UPI001A8F29D6|nr:RHS repeat-associated core domain-containing protein [Amycolatopsis sp. MtRt-6]
MTNPAFTGASLLESAADLKSAIDSGDWATTALAAAGAGLDALGAVMDPFGTILSQGVGWLMEHVGPLKEALDALAGDPAEIAAHAEAWQSVGAELAAIGTDLAALAAADTPSWTGPAADAYHQRTTDTAQLLLASQNAAEGAAGGVRTAGELVGAVRSLVRDIIAELVGRMISWALQVLGTFGIGLTWVVPQVARAVASTAAKIASLTGRVIDALDRLVPLLKRAGDVFGDASAALRRVDAGSVTPSRAVGDLPTRPSAVETLPGDGGAVTPSHAGGGAPGGSTPTHPDGDAPGATPPPQPSTPDTPAATKPSSATRPLSERGNPAEHDVPVKDRTLCADPIDVATGWVVLAQDDAEFAGALPLVVSRTHISAYRYGRLFGPSWASTLDQRLEAGPGGLDLALADGTVLTFPVPAGADPVVPDSGPRLRLWRDGDGYAVGDPATERLLFFDRDGRLHAEGDGDGNRVVIVYDAAGLPAELRHSGGYRLLVETADGLVTALHVPGADTPLARYAYDAQRRLTEVTDARGVPTKFTYDADGRIVRWEDCTGRWYRYGFDALGRCVRTESDGGHLDCTLEYDRENRVTRLTDSLGATTTYRLDERLRVVAETDPLGHTSTVDIDAHGRVRGRTDALGRTTAYELDDAGNVVRVTRPDGGVAVAEYDGNGRPVLRVGPDGAAWQWEYDPRGKLVRATDPVGAVTRYGYDEAGNIAAVTDALGGVTRFENNAAGLPVSVTDPLGATTRYEYDGFGRVTTVVSPLGAVTRMRWAPGGDLRERVAPDGATWRWSDAASGAAEEAVDARGLVSRTEFGPFDLPIADEGPAGQRLEYTYDTELRLVAVTDGQGLVWRYEYDAAGNPVSETDFNGRTTRYGYDAAGQLVRVDRADGGTVLLERDVLGRIVTRRAGSDVAVFAYDAADRLISARNDVAEVTFAYDPLGRVVAESVDGRVVHSAYDVLGRRTLRRTPSGAQSAFAYDAAGRPVALRTGTRELWFTHDRGGRELSRRFGHTELRQWWDPQDRLLGQAVRAGDRTTQRREYAYLPDGHLAGVTDALSGPRALEVDAAGRVRSVSGPAWREDYAYSASGAITHAGWPAGLLSFGGSGWRSPRPEAEPRMSPDAAVGPRRYAGTLLTAAGDTVYRHDALGRTVERQRHGRSWHYRWNSDDRLTGVGTPDGTEWVYRYDALGRRIAKLRLDGDGRVAEAIGFTWDGTELAEETHAGMTVGWDREPEAGRPIAQTERWGTGERFHTIVTDLVGAPAELVDEAGEIAWHPRATLWGKVADEPARAWTPLRFPGQYHDRETGLHYNFHRYYDPETGRYLSHDPLGLGPAPDSLAYVPNPTRQIDPLGLTGVTPCAAGGSGGGKRPPGSNPGLTPGSSSGPQPPKRAKTGYAEGTHGAKGREQQRLTKLFDAELKGPGGPAKGKVSGDTHQSEHPIGYEVLGRGSAAKRGAGEQQKQLENHAPAYQEEYASHRAHIGTGTSSRTAESGFTAQSYRDSQRNALEAGDPNTAIQLNQLDYAHQQHFHTTTGTVAGNIADDSYRHMVENAKGKGVTYATGPGVNATTPPMSTHDVRELKAAREAARTGKFPDHQTYEEELEQIHRKYPDPTPQDWAALKRGDLGGPSYDSDDG